MVQQKRSLSLAMLSCAALVSTGCGNLFGTSGTTGTGGAASTGTGDTMSSSVTGGGGAGTGGSEMATSSAGTTGTGGAAAEYANCPIDQFPADQQIAFDGEGTTGAIDQDTTFTKDHLYLIRGTLTVESSNQTPITLTVEAGTTLCFSDGMIQPGGIRIAPSAPANLIIQGTAAEPVILTSTGGKDAFWKGIDAGPNYSVFSFSHVEIYNASEGGGAGIGAVVVSNFPDVPAVTLNHVTMHRLRAGGGLILGNQSGLTPDSHVTIADVLKDPGPSQYPVVQVDPLAAGTLLPGMLDVSATDVPEALRVIKLTRNEINKSATWQNTGLPYLTTSGDFTVRQISSSDPPPTLTLSPGVEWRFEPGYSLRIGGSGGFDPGNLVVNGAVGKPVVLTASGDTSNASSYWGGVWFQSGAPGSGFDPAISKIDHARIEYGGASFNGMINCHDAASPSDPGRALVLISGASTYEGPAITNTELTHSAGDGVRAKCTPLDCIDSAADYTKAGNSFTAIAGVAQYGGGACP
jgi:hypothetical protein